MYHSGFNMYLIISRALILSVFLLVQSCMIWDFVKPAGNGISVDTEIVARSEERRVGKEGWSGVWEGN